ALRPAGSHSGLSPRIAKQAQSLCSQVEPALEQVPVAVSAQVPAGLVVLLAWALAVAAPVQAVQAGALVRAEASVPVPVSVSAQGLVLPVCLVLKERGRQAGQPQAEAGQVELASTSAA
ncbi:MAG: hypothetical protein WCO62_12480, partial [Betaproteobacteria bacterium]